MDEKQIEKYIKLEVEKLGGICLKFVSPGVTGVPDRVLIFPDAIAYWVEVKRDGGKLTPRQEYVIRQFKKRGHAVAVVRGMDEARHFIERLKNATT